EILQDFLYHCSGVKVSSYFFDGGLLEIIFNQAQRSHTKHPDSFRYEVDVGKSFIIQFLKLLMKIKKISAGDVPVKIPQFLIMNVIVGQQQVEGLDDRFRFLLLIT